VKLDWQPAADHPDLLAKPVYDALGDLPAKVAPIDPSLSDTTAFCEQYDVPLTASANCVVVHGKRAGESRYAAVMVLASQRADINGAVRRFLDVRKVSLAAREETVETTSMEYGGITPIGLPPEWPVLVDTAVAEAGPVVIGSGIRGSKLLLDGADLAKLPTAQVLDLAV
jgi:prolyl-tRNA editing enzyme YbaK/EbsC (Cys-tRNA(Pro) deacylase)